MNCDVHDHNVQNANDVLYHMYEMISENLVSKLKEWICVIPFQRLLKSTINIFKKNMRHYFTGRKKYT